MVSYKKKNIFKIFLSGLYIEEEEEIKETKEKQVFYDVLPLHNGRGHNSLYRWQGELRRG